MDSEQQTTNVSLSLLHATTQTIKHTHTILPEGKSSLEDCLSGALMFCVNNNYPYSIRS